MKHILFLGFCLIAIKSYSQSFININPNIKPAPFEHNVDVIHTKIEPQFDLKNGVVNGVVTHDVKGLRPEVNQVFFHGDKMKYSSITQLGKACSFISSDTGVYVNLHKKLTWDETTSIEIKYSCTPRKGLYFVGWSDTTNRCRKQLWTQGEGEDNRAWIPMYDKPNDKYTTEMIVDFDNKYKVLSNGKLLESKAGTTTTRWHYKMQHPHAGYLIMLGVGEYEIENRKSKNGVEVGLWYYPDMKNTVASSYLYSTECIDFLEEQTGVAFPWENYSNIPVQDFMFGAMENTTATIFGDFYLTDPRAAQDRSYMNTNVHELTHQWFGDLVTNRNWDHIWLQESFATYYPKIFQRKMYGDAQYEWMRRQEQNATLAAGERNSLPIVHLNSGTERVYSKGSTVIDMLNYVYGEAVFRKVINHYLTQLAYKNVETNDLIQAYQDVAGISPQWFFDQWIYKGGEPNYQVTTIDYTEKNANSFLMTVSQLQKQSEAVGLFTMPVVVEFYYKNGNSKRDTIWVKNETETFKFEYNLNDELDFVLFDPGSYITKKITFVKPTIQLLSQANKAKHYIDRYDAWVGLRNDKSEEKLKLLMSSYANEQHQGIEVEIINQLGAYPKSQVRPLIIKAFASSKPEVRAAAFGYATHNFDDYKNQIVAMLQDSSYNNISNALDYLVQNDEPNSKVYFDATQLYKGIGNKVRIKWLELIINSKYNNAIYENELIDYTSQSF
jgi:aminopeptidase N